MHDPQSEGKRRPVLLGNPEIRAWRDGDVWHLDAVTPLGPVPRRWTDRLVSGAAAYPDRTLVARRIESGICHINGPTVHDEAQMPFGGVKGSGYGRFGGKAAIAEFTDLRWITVQTGPRHYPI